MGGMRLAIVGANGYLGRALADRLDAVLVTEELTREGWASLREFDRVILAAGGAGDRRCQEDPWRAIHAHVPPAGWRGPATCYLSSQAVYARVLYGRIAETDPPRPDTFYGWLKWLGETAVRARAADALILRLGHVYGGAAPARGVLYEMLRSGQRTGAIRVDRRCDWAFVHVADVVEAVERWCALARWGGVYNLVGENLTLAEVARLCAQAIREHGGEPPLVTAGARDVGYVLATTKLEAALGWRPQRTLAQWLAEGRWVPWVQTDPAG